MKDTILKMLEEEPLVKKAFLLLLSETAQEEQDELLEAIKTSFEAGEPYKAVEDRLEKMLYDEYTEELKKGGRKAIQWLMAHFPLNELGDNIGWSNRLDYRAVFPFQYDREGGYFKDVNEETENGLKL